MKFQGEARLASIAAEGHFNRKTTVPSFGASTLSTAAYDALRALTTPAGGKMMCSSVAFTSRAVSMLPSWNLMPLRIMKVYVRPSPEMVQLSATSPTIFG
jgi:hypothetical protein